MNKTDTLQKNNNKEGTGYVLRKKIQPWTKRAMMVLLMTFVSFQVMAQRAALSLDGNGDYATAAHNAALDISGYNITLEAWVKHDGNSVQDAFIINKGVNGSGYRLQLIGEGDETYLRFVIGDLNNGGPQVISESGLPANRWTHVAATYDGQFLKIYIDGELDATDTETRSIGSNSNNLTLGTDASLSTNFLSGQMDGVRIWNTTRSAFEIADSYLEKLTGSEAGLIALYDFDDVTSSTVNDMAGSSGLSMVGDATVVTPGAVPIAPEVYIQNKNGQVELTWDERLGPNNENDAASFEIYRSTQPDGSDRTSVATAASTVSSFTDTDVDNGVTYYYEVTTVNGSGNESDFSRNVNATPYSQFGGASLHLSKNAYGAVSERPSLDITGTGITVHAWIKHDGQSDENAVIMAKGSTDGGYVLRFDGKGQAPRLAFAIGDVNNGGPTIISNSSIPAHQWTHVAGTYDGTDLKVYVNGKLDATNTETRTIGNNDLDLFIGADAAASSYFYSGQIDELGIWSVALPRQDIEDHFNSPYTGNEEGLELYYKFDDTGNSIVRSSDTYHTDMELIPVNGDIGIQASGVFPVAPYRFTKASGSLVNVSVENRDGAAAAQYKLYRSTTQDGSDRTEIATLSSSSSYSDADVQAENSYFYEATVINAEGQESDLSYIAPARVSSYRAGHALELDGELDYVRFDSRNSLDGYEQLYQNYDHSMTVEAWVNHDGNSDENAIILQKGSTGGGYMLRLEGAGDAVTASFTIGDINNSGPRVVSGSSIPANQWTHIAATYDGTDLKIYINGQLDGTDSETRSIGSNGQPLLLGAPNALDANFFSGAMDEIRIWNVTRTESEIADNYYKMLNGSQDGLITYLRFDEDLGSSLTHSSATRAMSGELQGDATFINSNALSSQPVIENPIQEVTIEEDFGTLTVADLDTVFQDDDNPVLSYSIKVPCHIVEAEIQQDTSLVFQSLDNIFGTDTLEVQASDGATTVSQKLIVNVTSVNDLPELAGFENNIKIAFEGSFTADMYARTGDVESPDSALTYSFSVDTSGINIDFDGRNLTLSPNKGFDGSATLDIKVTDEDGGETTVTVGVDMVESTEITEEPGVPEEFKLHHNYPNPFNPTTNIKYALPEASQVQLTVFNTLGQEVAKLVNKKQAAGSHSVVFDAKGLPSGMYIYRLRAANFEKTQKMMLVK